MTRDFKLTKSMSYSDHKKAKRIRCKRRYNKINSVYDVDNKKNSNGRIKEGGFGPPKFKDSGIPFNDNTLGYKKILQKEIKKVGAKEPDGFYLPFSSVEDANLFAKAEEQAKIAAMKKKERLTFSVVPLLSGGKARPSSPFPHLRT